MVVERAGAGRRGGPGEIEGTQQAVASRRADHLDDVRIGLLLLAHDLGADGADVDRRVGERAERGAHALRRNRRYVPLHVHHDLGIAADLLQRLVDAAGAVDVVVAGHRRLAAGGPDGVGDRTLVGRHDDAADAGLDSPAPDMDDHRLARDVGHGLAGQAACRHAGGHEHDGLLHIRRALMVESFEWWQKVLMDWAYTGCFEGGKACSFRPRTATFPGR